MQTKPNISQTVGYVAPPAKAGGAVKILKGVVLESYADGSARLDITPRKDNGEAADPEKAPLGHHIAIAHFHTDKKSENTWHFLEEDSAQAPGASEESSTKPRK